MKRIISVVSVLVLAVSMFAGVVGFAAATTAPKATAAPVLVAAPSAKLLNGDFAKSANGKTPDNWDINVWDNIGTITYTPKSAGSAAFVTISSDKPADARLKQLVALAKNSTYAFACEIKASGFTDKSKNGAVLSVLGKNESSVSKYETKGFEKAVVYLVTGDAVDGSYPLTIGIGGHATANAGTAEFRNVTLKKVKAAPKNAAIITLSQSANGGGTTTNDVKVPESSSSIMWIIIIVGVILAGGIAYYLIVMKKSANPSEESSEEKEEEESEETIETFEDEKDDTKKEPTESKEDDLL
ncbi:MAG: hypothetical protein WCL54_01825 [Clostridia bacterium]